MKIFFNLCLPFSISSPSLTARLRSREPGLPGPEAVLRPQLPPHLHPLQLAHLPLWPRRERRHDVCRQLPLLRRRPAPLPQPGLWTKPLLPRQEAGKLGVNQPGTALPPSKLILNGFF